MTTSESSTLELVQKILRQHDVSLAKPKEFLVLQQYDICLILDDSSSMKLKAGSTTRWGELLNTCSQIVDLACCLDDDGIDVYFLNGGKISNVCSSQDTRLQAAFQRGPCRGTPLTETLEAALHDHEGKKPLLVIICSDGVPNGGVRKLASLIQKSIKQSAGKIRYQLMACTDNDADVAWMDELDDAYNEVDATDDFMTERTQVLQAGYFKKFERGDWVAKALLGAVSKKWNCLDDRAHLVDDDTSTAASSSDPVVRHRQEDPCAPACALQ